jgi:hypothetical protein
MSCQEHGPRIEAGQILNPDCFPPPNELVCIQVPKVFDQVALRECVTQCVKIKRCGPEGHGPIVFEGITDFDIVEVKVISKTDSLSRPGFKKLKLFVKLGYKIHYSIGGHHETEYDEAAFNLTVNEIYCPSCVAQVGVIKAPEGHCDNDQKTLDVDGTLIKVEALAEAFNDMVCQETGVLTFDIGAFFIVKCECVVQLLMPAYGYCPVPPEQINPANLNCRVFNDKTKTPFPTKFFPDQKWNPLDKCE